jgi:hypothetical protein
VGKKSRLSRERRERSLKDPENMLSSTDGAFHRRSQLENLFMRYNAEDVCVSLGVSDLWLPNISSQVKHCFALGVFASMTPSRFASDVRISGLAVSNPFSAKYPIPKRRLD